jgi:hypothetical protein
MATTTPNFGWSVPTSSDLVKNGAVAIETLGDSIDASMVDLKGGTTGQVLSKTSNTDMDFTWATSASGALTKITSNTFSAVSSVSLPNSTFSSTYTNYKVVLIISSSSGSTTITGRYRASGTDNTSSIYNSALSIARVNTNVAVTGVNGGTSFTMGYNASTNNGPFGQSYDFLSPQAAAEKQIVGTGFGYNSELDQYAANWFGGHGNATTQFDSFSWISGTGTITGSYAVYGYQS